MSTKVDSENIMFIEKELRTLRKSSLMRDHEFKDMYSLIERHHRDVRLAHLTGKAKDLMEHAKHDTKFFNILVRMMGEVTSSKPGREQKHNLQKVYIWYQTNKHVLHSGPIFGKAHRELESRSVLRIANTPEGKRPGSRNSGSARSQNSNVSSGSKNSQDKRLGTPPQLQREKISNTLPTPTIQVDGPDRTPQTKNGHSEQDVETFSESDETQPKQPTLPPSETSDTNPVPKRMVHSIASMINPHVQLAEEQERKGQKELASPVKIRVEAPSGENPRNHPGTPKRSRTPIEEKNARLRAWNEFLQEQNYGQDLLGKMSFSGRSGTPHSVRYTAHEFGEMPETETSQVIAQYARIAEAENAPTYRRPDGKTFVSQTIQEFYSTADNYYPPKLPKYCVTQQHQPSSSRASERKTTSMSARSDSRTSGLPSRATSVQGNTMTKVMAQMGQTDGQSSTDMRLDTVVNLIDSVTGDMTTNKEKLMPDPIPGFRPPTTPVQLVRPNTAPVYGSSLTPRQRSNSLAELDDSRKEADLQEVVMSPPDQSDYTVHFRKPVPVTNISPVLQAIDWRGKITPDSTRYRWAETKFGGHTYIRKLKKQRKMSLRTQGSTSAGSRPKTAPMTMQERWKTEKPSDDNERIAQAASHMTTEVDPDTVSAMVVVHNLGSGTPRSPPPRVVIERPGVPEDDVMQQLKMGHVKFSFRDPEHPTTPSIPTYREYPPPEATKAEFMSFITPKSVLVQSKVPPRSDSKCDSYTASAGPPVPLHSAAGDTPSISSAHVSQKQGEGTTEADSTVADQEIEKLDLGSLEDLFDKEQEDTPKADDTDRADETDQADDTDRTLEDQVADDSKENDTSVANEKEENMEVDNSTCMDNTKIKESVAQEDEDLQKALEQVSEKYGLSLSDAWTFSPDADIQQISFDEYMKSRLPDPSKLINGEYWLDAIKKPHNYCTDCRPQTAPTPNSRRKKLEQNKVVRAKSAIVKPNNVNMNQIRLDARSMGDKPQRMLSAPVRSSPSIPSPHMHAYGGRSPRAGSAYIPELEHHARTLRSPRKYMTDALMKTAKQIVELRRRSPDRSREQDFNPEDDLAASLKVVSLNVSKSRPRSAVSEDNSYTRQLEAMKMANRDGEGDDVYDTVIPDGRASPKSDISEFTTLTSERLGILGSMQQLGPKGDEVSSVSSENSVKQVQNEESSNEDNKSAAQENTGSSTPQQSDPQEKPGSSNLVQDKSGSSTPLKTSQPGRPIPQYKEAPDPVAVAEAVKRQQEAKAAVDIQRIFRGYQARRDYSYLLKEERERREDKRKAAIEIQRTYRGHLSRKKQIYNRNPNPETLEWAKEYKNHQRVKEYERFEKQQERAKKHFKNKYEAEQKLELIGPHADMYDVFHPKHTGPTKKQITLAAIIIQKHARGMLLRQKFDALKRKSQYHAGSWQKFVLDYKDLLRRIQKRYGMERYSTPFSIEQVDKFMDLKRRYESVFDKKAFGQELEMEDLMPYFKECDLYPAKVEVDDALDVVFRGKKRKRRNLLKSEVLEITFHIYVPEATGLQDRRRSTWMHPIVNGEEAWKMEGSDLVEPAPLKPCLDLVMSSMKERNEAKAAERKRQEEIDEVEKKQRDYNEKLQREQDEASKQRQKHMEIYKEGVVESQNTSGQKDC